MAGWIKTPKWDNLFAFDTETTINSDKLIGPDCRHHSNKVVMLGNVTAHEGAIRLAPSYNIVKRWKPTSFGTEATANTYAEGFVVCGHNIKFDFHAISSMPDQKVPTGLIDAMKGEDNQKVEIWDTQVGAYLISGQRLVSPSLIEAAQQAGVPFTKAPEVALAFQNDIGADKIDQDMLAEYLVKDVETTYLVAKWQIAECQRLGIMQLAVSMMRAVRELYEIEATGMSVSASACSHRQALNDTAVASAVLDMRAHLERCKTPRVLIDNLNPGSLMQLSILIRGGNWEYSERVLDGKYKNGNDKYTTVTRVVSVNSVCLLGTCRLFTGSVDSEFLEAASAATSKKDPLIEALIQYRKHSKLNGTYIEPIKKRADLYGGKIYPNFNTTITKTGRLSSSNPNFQNMAGGDNEDSAKQVFVPREGHAFVELDYKQMEVVALYLHSQCADLGRALRCGTDIHNETGRLALGWVPRPEERRAIKAVNFGLIYGGGAKTLSAQSGLDLDTTKACIKSFFDLYPGVKKWREEYIKTINSSTPYFVKTELGSKPIEYRQAQTPTGRLLTFNHYPIDPSKPWMSAGVSPTETANYPIQSLATGDISQTMLWVLGGMLRKKYEGKVKIVNTVHDSYLLECPAAWAAAVALFAQNVLESADEIILRIFGIRSDVKFKVDTKIYYECWGGK